MECGNFRLATPHWVYPPQAFVTAVVDPLLADALRDRYLLEKELGRGGTATVYLAHDLRHRRLVAFKVLAPELGVGVGPERFRREIETAAQLEHPHILPVHDSGETAGRLWYTMPYVEGESLRGRVGREGPLPVDEAIRLTREVADALDYAHSRGIVHRDIKPENILLSRGHARVADFGIAKALAAAGSERLTSTGFTVGTPAYLSPEQAAGGEADPRSDVYALGCVLYEMLAGEPPFTGPTAQAVIGRRFVEPAPPVRRLRAGVPILVEEAVARALAREPADRFQTAAEFAHTLAEAAALPRASPTPEALPIPVPRPPGRRRRWRLPAGVALLLLGFALGLGVLFAFLRQDREGAISAHSKLLVVLPFENLGDSTDQYFADGVSDAIRGKLAALHELQVIAGASSSEYRHTTKSPREIARELGVRYLLVGKVLRERTPEGAGRVKVSPELMEVGVRGAPTTRWQEPLEAAHTDVFRLQADIAGRVAEALGVALNPGERLQLAQRPTHQLAAYEAFLRGEQQMAGTGVVLAPDVVRRALPYYGQAIALDSSFAEAWAQLSRGHSFLYGNGLASPTDAEAARRAAERSLAVGPNRPEGRLALGDYYSLVRGEHGRALEQYALGLSAAPSNIDLLTDAAQAESRLGRWEPALEHLRRAQILDPRSAAASLRLAETLGRLRRYAEAHEAADRALALAPTSLAGIQAKAMIYLGQGDLQGAAGVVRSAMTQVEPAALVAYFGYYWDLYWVLETPEQELLLRLPPSAFDNSRAAWGLVMAQTYALRGDGARARIYADSARVSFEEQLNAAPGDAQLHALYGLTLAYLGRARDAVREGERGVELLPLGQHTVLAPYIQHQLVRIYAMVGEPEKALDRLEPLLKVPYYLSPGWLSVDPTFAPLRSHARFRRLLQNTA